MTNETLNEFIFFFEHITKSKTLHITILDMLFICPIKGIYDRKAYNFVNEQIEKFGLTAPYCSKSVQEYLQLTLGNTDKIISDLRNNIDNL